MLYPLSYEGLRRKGRGEATWSQTTADRLGPYSAGRLTLDGYSDGEQRFDGSALVHGCVPFGSLV